jgi:hypothetical protein
MLGSEFGDGAAGAGPAGGTGFCCSLLVGGDAAGRVSPEHAARHALQTSKIHGVFMVPPDLHALTLQ